MKVEAVVHGAISLVNAVPAGKGATVGIGLETVATVESEPGFGVGVDGRDASLRLIRHTVEKSVSKRDLARNRLTISVRSEIPAGYGLKSSSAISTAISLACHRIFGGMSDRRVLLDGVEASVAAGVSITGAYDDACSCYYGGFNVTDNAKKKRARFGHAPPGLVAVIHIPEKRRRRNPRGLRKKSAVFVKAWTEARRGNYWEAMAINGFATTPTLGADPSLIGDLVNAGALGASVSGNGPAVAAVCKKADVARVRRAFSGVRGRIITSPLSNKKAAVHAV